MSAPRHRVLVVDDDSDIRSILQTKLEASGFEVLLAENGQDGVEKAKQGNIDIIVMDVRMPIMSGTEALSVLKADDKLKQIPVIFLSNFGEEKEVDAWIDQKFAKDLGAVDYLKKSEDLSKITARIQALLPS
jgi:two-component system alkaline phosphatase synthesis response regulator PhoP